MTIHISKDPKANELINKDGTALLIGMLLDQQVPMEWAFTGPYTLSNRLGHLSAREISKMPQDKFVEICRQKPAIHRFPRSMGLRIHQLCTVITDSFMGQGENVWIGINDAIELKKRLRTLPGFGEEKAQIFVALLAKQFGIKPRNWKSQAGVFSDCLPRTIADCNSAETLLQVKNWKKSQREQDRDKQDRPLK